MRVKSAVALTGAVVAVAAATAIGSPWPPSATPAPGGLRVQLSTPGSGDQLWTLDVFRPRAAKRRSPGSIPGSIDYCLAVSLTRGEGRKRWRGITCALSAAIVLRIQRQGLRLDCGAIGFVVGRPAEPGPTCGLAPADTQRVTVSAENGPAAAAVLSEPFRVRFNRGARILKRAGIDPARVRALPRRFRVRAFLAFLPTPPTPPGGRTPRLTVSATRADGSTLTRRIGGSVLPTSAPKPPPSRPAPGAPRARLAVTGADGRRWKTTAWRAPDRVLCTNVRLAGRERSPSLACHGTRVLTRILRGGPQAYTEGPVRGRRDGTYAVYGFVRAQALALTIVDSKGRRFGAKLSPVFTTIRRSGRAIHVKAFLAAVPGPPPSRRRGLEFETRLSNGTTESGGGGLYLPAQPQGSR